MPKMGGGVLKFSRGFALHTRKKNSASYVGYHLGRVLSRISLISCTVFLMRLVKAFYGSTTSSPPFFLVSPFSRGVIFTRARVSLALLSLKTNGGLLVV